MSAPEAGIDGQRRFSWKAFMQHFVTANVRVCVCRRACAMILCAIVKYVLQPGRQDVDVPMSPPFILYLYIY